MTKEIVKLSRIFNQLTTLKCELTGEDTGQEVWLTLMRVQGVIGVDLMEKYNRKRKHIKTKSYDRIFQETKILPGSEIVEE